MKIDALVEQTKIEDELFINEGVNNDDLQDSLMYYMAQKDEEVQEAMVDGMLTIRKERQKLQSGGEIELECETNKKW